MSRIGYKPHANYQVVLEKSAIGNWKLAIFLGFVTVRRFEVSMQSEHSPGINKEELRSKEN